VVLDTNVLVSGTGYPASVPGRIMGAWRRGAIRLVLSQYILEELARVLPRMNHRLKWAPADFADYIDILSLQVELVDPQPLDSAAVRDPGDVPVLGTLVASNADYLITGDDDLLALAERYSIVTPGAFWKKHGS
jgi:putative PIN family toxin of toxin-antitoxin system